MEVLYIMYVEIERNVRGYQVVTLCNGIRKVYCTDSFGVAIQIVVELGKKIRYLFRCKWIWLWSYRYAKNT